MPTDLAPAHICGAADPVPGTLALHLATIDRPTPATLDALGDALRPLGGCVHVDGDCGAVWGEPYTGGDVQHDPGWHVTVYAPPATLEACVDLAKMLDAHGRAPGGERTITFASTWTVAPNVSRVRRALARL